MRIFDRIGAGVLALSLVSGCAVTRQQRRGLVIGGAVVTAATAVWAVSFMLKECPSGGAGSSQACEDARIDDRNQVAAISVLALAATIVFQLLPVSDPERPPPAPLAVRPPPPPSARASELHDPMAITLANNARQQAAAGNCTQAYGSLKALASIDPAMAEQLRTMDPYVGRCRKASEAEAAGAVVVPAPPPSGPPGATPMN